MLCCVTLLHYSYIVDVNSFQFYFGIFQGESRIRILKVWQHINLADISCPKNSAHILEDFVGTRGAIWGKTGKTKFCKIERGGGSGVAVRRRVRGLI